MQMSRNPPEPMLSITDPFAGKAVNPRQCTNAIFLSVIKIVNEGGTDANRL
jgi:hypothetical protein